MHSACVRVSTLVAAVDAVAASDSNAREEMDTASTKLRKTSRCAFVALQNSVAFVRSEDGEDMHTVWMQNSLCEAAKPWMFAGWSCRTSLDPAHFQTSVMNTTGLVVRRINGDCRFEHFISHDFGLLVRQLAFTSFERSTRFFGKVGHPTAASSLRTYAPSQFTFGIWKDGRTVIRRSRRQCSADIVKGMNPAPHIHEHLRYTIMATALRTPSRITTSRLSTLR